VVTVERARLVTDAEPEPEPAGPAAKLTVYCGRAERTACGSAARAVIEHARMHGATAGSVLLGLDGTVHGVRRRARFASRNADVPLMVIVVGPGGAIAAARAGIVEMLDDPVVTLERVAIGDPPPKPADDSDSQWWQKLMVHCGADASSDGRPLHLAVLDAIRAEGLAGATSLRGNWGFAAGSRPHGDSARALRRRTPVLTVAIDRPQAVERAWPALESLVAAEGVVTREWVPVVDSRPSAQASPAWP
jgi:PII-like signaling protein